MQNNFVAAIEAAPANNQVNNSNTNIMNNYTIDFTSALGEAAVAQTATVDLQVVSDIYNAFMAIPQEVVVRFRYDNGFLKMVVQMNHRDKFFHKYETPADVKLVESMIAAMAAGQIGALKAYTNEEHQLVASDTDPRVDIFKQFIASPLRCRFEQELITKKGDRYVCASFNLGYRKQIKFCLKRTEEVEAIINEAIQAA
jgi:hypothetical protein